MPCEFPRKNRHFRKRNPRRRRRPAIRLQWGVTNRETRRAGSRKRPECFVLLGALTRPRSPDSLTRRARRILALTRPARRFLLFFFGFLPLLAPPRDPLQHRLIAFVARGLGGGSEILPR